MMVFYDLFIASTDAAVVMQVLKKRRAISPAETPPKRIWFILVDHQRQLRFGEASSLVVSADTDVENLTKMIKENNEKYLAPFMHNELVVWKYDHKELSAKSPLRKLQQIVDQVEFSGDSANLTYLSPVDTMMEIDIPENRVLLVQVPPPQTPDTAGSSGSECLIRLLAPTQLVRQTRCQDI
jgi:hypothetical protein